MKTRAHSLKTLLDPRPAINRQLRERARCLSASNLALGVLGLTGLVLLLRNAGGMAPGFWAAFLGFSLAVLLAFGPRLGMTMHRAFLLTSTLSAALTTLLCLLTGGMSSFLLVWFSITPILASISGQRRLTLSGLGLSALGVCVLWLLSSLGLAGQALWSAENLALALTASALGAGLFSALVIISVQRVDRRTENEARAGEERYRFLTDNALDMIIRHRPDGSIAYVSKACRDILGYSPEELLAFEPGSLIYRADRKGVEIALSRAAEFGEEATIQYRMRRKTGDFVWLEMRCRPVSAASPADCPIINTSSGSLVGIGEGFRPEPREIIAVARDISKAKDHEQDLIHARELAEAGSRSRLHFLANVSHELRTPLSAINGFSDIMKRQMFGPMGNPKYAEYAGLINMSGNHLLELINDLLDMSKIEAGKYKLDHESIFFPVIIENCLRLVRLQMEKAGVRLHVDLPHDLSRIEADARACKQILLNLLSNAIKFTEPGGDITISMFNVGPLQVLEVSDTGIGINEADLERLGRPYEQARRSSDFSANDRATAGTGLGLSLVRSLTELHGGQFGIFSEEGEGTTVQIALPITAPDGLAVDAPFPGIFNDGEAGDVGIAEEARLMEEAKASEGLDDAA